MNAGHEFAPVCPFVVAVLFMTPELKRIWTIGMSYGHPVIARELAHDPLPTEPPEPTVLLAAERARRRVVDSMVIHMGHSGLNSQREPHTALAVPREHRGREAVLGLIGDVQRLLFILDLDYGCYRAEDFVLCDSHVVRHVGKDVRRQHLAIGQAAQQLARALLPCARDAGQMTAQLLLVDHWSDRHRWIARITVFERLYVSNEAIDELIVDARVYDDPVRAHADLALMEETADDSRPYRMFQVGIVEDDERRVAAELQRHSLELWGLDRKRTNMSAHSRRTRERDQPGNRVRGEWITNLRDRPDDDVENTRR